jgi:hypothetical protein
MEAMGTRRDGNEPPLIEPTPLTEIFTTGLASVDHRGEYVRLTFFSEYSIAERDLDACERVVVARVVMPRGAFSDLVRRVHFGAH